MKKIVGVMLLMVMALIAMPAKSQIKFGIKGGLNVSSVHFNKEVIGKDNVTGCGYPLFAKRDRREERERH